MTLESPVATKAARTAAAPATPISPHNSHAGKNAPKRVNDGAPPVEQAVKEIQSRDRRASVAFTLLRFSPAGRPRLNGICSPRHPTVPARWKDRKRGRNTVVLALED